jgi:hypothetical protein
MFADWQSIMHFIDSFYSTFVIYRNNSNNKFRRQYNKHTTIHRIKNNKNNLTKARCIILN